jgi:hypothetical protein
VSIIEDVANGSVVYAEEHTATTNDIGLINLAVGGGTVAQGLFSNIDWGNHSYFMKISVDISGGSTYVAMGTTQLRSVPYALFAETSNNAGPQGIQGVAGNDGVDGIDGTNGLDGIDGVDGLAGAQGIQGIQGLQGDTGVAGVQGSIGLTGAQGIQGLQGDTGIAGTNGVNGIDGTNGVDGADGTNGVDGLNGTNGAVGATGLQGIQGVAGNDGADGTNGTNGVNGAVGATGTQGIQGVAGNDGADGTNGIDGVDGAVGATGTQGIQGVAGNDGADGTNGIDGTNGVDGAVGATGTQGIQGVAGNDGADGVDGIDGTNGTNGVNGAVGATGTQGIQGVAGNDGADGTNGIDGAVGATGTQGIQGVAGNDGVDGVDGTNGIDGIDAVVDYDSLANLISIDSTFITNVSGATGGGCDWQFPDGIGESIHLTGYPLSYTVPSGKNLYINYANVTDVDLVINNMKVVSISNVNSTPPTFKVPIIATDGDVVTLVSNSGSTNGASLLGFLVDKIVEPITIDLVNNPYTIPSNKTFVLFNGNGSSNSALYIYLNGISTGIIYGNETPVEEQESVPIIFKSGDVLADQGPGTSTGTHILNGYLVDDNYFAGCGGGGSSSTSSLDSTTIANMIAAAGGGGCDIKFPEGLDGDDIVHDLHNNYTVPTGKNLYINHVYLNMNSFIIDTVMHVHGFVNYRKNSRNQANNSTFNIIAGEGQVLSSGNPGPGTASFTGFLVDITAVEPISYSLGGNSNGVISNPTYTVPSNKRLIINHFYNSNFDGSFFVDGIPIHYGQANNNAGGTHEIAFSQYTITVNGGSVVSIDHSNESSFNGYLVDENYFADCGGSSSSASMPSGTNVGEMMFWDGTNWVVVSPPSATNTDSPSLMFVNGVPTWLIQVLGCTDSLSIDYSPLATIDDGSCNYISIGSIYQGGIVIWIDSTGKHGLITDLQDLGKVEWGCSGTLISGADGTAIGTGAQNTIDIEAGCTTPGIAADLCANSQAQGYFDWFLPSIDELHLIYLAKPVINLALGNTFANSYTYYWASTEQNSINAYYLNMDNGMIYSNPGLEKSAYTLYVRAVRAF